VAAAMYEHGMMQPGVVVEDANGKILYFWAIVPSKINFVGATDRPLVADIVSALEHIITHGSTPGYFGSTDLAYLEQNHPDQHKTVMVPRHPRRKTQSTWQCRLLAFHPHEEGLHAQLLREDACAFGCECAAGLAYQYSERLPLRSAQINVKSPS